MGQKRISRNPNPDAVKGVCAVLVITEHLLSRDVAFLGGSSVLLELLMFGLMQVFFFYSGAFSLSGLQQPVWKYLYQRTLRLLVPYIMWSSAAVVTKAALSILSGSFSFADTVMEEVNTLLYAKSIWFLLSLYLVQVFFRFLAFVYKRNPYLSLLIVVLFILIPMPDYLTLSRTQELIACFGAGILYRIHEEKVDRLLKSWAKWLRFAAPIYMAAFGFFVKKAALWQAERGIMFLPAVLLGMVWAFSFGHTLLLLLGKLPGLKAHCADLGRFSLELYCIHMIFVGYLPFRFPAAMYQLPGIAVTVFYILLAWGIGIVCYLLSKYCLNKISIYRKLMLGQWKS